MIPRDEKDIPDISDEIRKHPVTTIIEELDCFAPRRVIRMEYSGPNIREVAKRAPRILREGMMITGTNTFIDDYYVDVTAFRSGVLGIDDAERVAHFFEQDANGRLFLWIRIDYQYCNFHWVYCFGTPLEIAGACGFCNPFFFNDLISSTIFEI